MNILPLVISLLLIFAFASSTLLQESVSTVVEEWSHRGFMRAERKLRNKWEGHLFKEAPKKPSEKTKNQNPHTHEEKKEFTKGYESPREKKISDLTKLNLAPLLTKPAPSYTGHLYEVAAQLIRLLYADKVFFKKEEHLEYQLLDTMIEKGIQNQALTSFTELFPDQPNLKTVYYKMLKGTNKYQLLSKEGIPPFTDFFIIDRSVTQNPIFFSFASKVILDALFTEKISALIIEEEKKKWEESHKYSALSEKELETTLLKDPTLQFNLSEFKDLLNFTKSAASSKCLVTADKETGIVMKKKL